VVQLADAGRNVPAAWASRRSTYTSLETRRSIESQRTAVFICYSHRDQRWLDRVMVHLRPLTRESGIGIWADTRLEAGSDWRNDIRDAVASAKVAILIVSADFLASDFIASDELPPLLEASEKEGAVILPVIAGASRFQQTQKLARFQSVNDPARPLAAMPDFEQESVLVKLANRVEQIFRSAHAEPEAADNRQLRPQERVISDQQLNECIKALGATQSVDAIAAAIREHVESRSRQRSDREAFDRQLQALRLGTNVIGALKTFASQLADCVTPASVSWFGFYVSTSKIAQAYKALRAINAVAAAADDNSVSRFVTMHEHWLASGRLALLPAILLLGGDIPSDPNLVCYFSVTVRLVVAVAELDGIPDAASLLTPRPINEMYAVMSRIFLNPDPFFYPLIRLSGVIGDCDVIILLSRKHIHTDSGTASSLASALAGNQIALSGFGVFEGSGRQFELRPFVCDLG
jgi:hypothetical protein